MKQNKKDILQLEIKKFNLRIWDANSWSHFSILEWHKSDSSIANINNNLISSSGTHTAITKEGKKVLFLTKFYWQNKQKIQQNKTEPWYVP